MAERGWGEALSSENRRPDLHSNEPHFHLSFRNLSGGHFFFFLETPASSFKSQPHPTFNAQMQPCTSVLALNQIKEGFLTIRGSDSAESYVCVFARIPTGCLLSPPLFAHPLRRISRRTWTWPVKQVSGPPQSIAFIPPLSPFAEVGHTVAARCREC